MSKNKHKKKVVVAVECKKVDNSRRIYFLEVLIVALVLLKLSLISTSQEEMNKAFIETSIEITKSISSLHEYEIAIPETKEIKLNEVKKYLNNSAENLIMFAGIKVPGCGYDINGNPFNTSGPAFARLTATTEGVPAGRLFDLGTEAFYPDGTPCKPRIYDPGILTNMQREGSRGSFIEWIIGIAGLIIILLK